MARKKKGKKKKDYERVILLIVAIVGCLADIVIAIVTVLDHL